MVKWAAGGAAVAIVAAGVGLACGGGGSSSSGAGSPTGIDQNLPKTGQVSFSKDVQAILDARCVRCHYDPATGTSTESPQKPPFNAERSYSSLVNAPVACAAHKQLVVPGDAASSALLGILSGTPVCGSIMPKNTTGLASFEPLEVGVIQRWIEQGAPNN